MFFEFEFEKLSSSFQKSILLHTTNLSILANSHSCNNGCNHCSTSNHQWKFLTCNTSHWTWTLTTIPCSTQIKEFARPDICSIHQLGAYDHFDYHCGNVWNQYRYQQCLWSDSLHNDDNHNLLFYIRNYWKRSLVVTMIFFFIGFIGFDGIYFSSVILKVASGGWVAILISIFFFVTFFSWWYGQRCLNEVSSRIHTGTPIKDFVARRVHEETTEEEEEEETTTHEIENKFKTVDLIDGSHIKVGRTPTMAVFLSSQHSSNTSQSFEMFLSLNAHNS